ncbi:MAG: restriction endonuclease subunit R [Cytophagales bacterium]|nr:MAG: restriction endonuclease subunit R [Cytophagales bacterium]
MQDKKIFNTQDLVLKVNPKGYNPIALPIDEWDRYLDILCQNRNYQREAIRTAIIYLFGGRYANIEKLVEENYKQNTDLQERYKNVQDYHKKLQLPNTLSATLDLATGTGKSYAIFGIAQMALGLGLVDKVLVLCPSLTIEKGLMDKFNELNNNTILANAIPASAKIKNPTIKDATTTIVAGDICVENIHAVYSKSQSSIQDSLGFSKGSTCLVLSDEVHHVYNTIQGNSSEEKTLKKWKEFLLQGGYGFKYMIGLTGTAYTDNEYFNDVIYRYSLKNAMQERIIKMVFYTSKDEEQKEDNIKFQKIYQNHQKNKEQYQNLKPLTLLVTKDIRTAKQQAEIFVEFLMKQEKITEEEAKKKVLLVTSAKEHEVNVKVYLPDIDKKENTFEYLVSVTMLTEGWDVKNVFQIVPMEERAFNSKLLIAQVLGRGLRLPLPYPNSQVIVFNHDSWSGKIKALVDEILEMELKLTSSTLLEGERVKYHFTLHNINYDREETLKDSRETQVFDYSKELIRLQSQTPEYETITEFENIDGQIVQRKYQVKKDTKTVAQIAHKIFEEFRTRKFEGIAMKLKDGEYTIQNIPKETIERIIRNSMKAVGIEGEDLTKVNEMSVYNAFSTLLRKKPKTVTFTRKVTPYFEISTQTRGSETISLSSLRRDTTVFYSINCQNEILHEDTLQNFDEIKNDRDFRGAFTPLNEYLLKTPIDLIFASSSPEEKFIENLCKTENAKIITSWLKSRNQSFYEIEYSLTRKGSTHTKKQQKFNPDFFIFIQQNTKNYILVIEIKAEGDTSDENIAKYRYTKQHFQDLNQILQEQNIDYEYIFHFLSPNSYVEFFAHLQNGKLLKREFTSELDKLLEEELGD